MGIPLAEASLSQPVVKEGEEEKEEEEEEKDPEGFVNFRDSQDGFEVFNHSLSPKRTSADLDYQQEVGTSTLDEMGIQRKSKKSLLELIESQPRKDTPREPSRPKLPSPPSNPPPSKLPTPT